MKTTINPSPSLIEALETRRLMSVSMQQDGVVVVTGTDGDDNVQIFANAVGSQPVLTIEVWTADAAEVVNLPLSAVTGVQVDGLAGNDRLFVDRTYDPSLAVPVTLFGGAGDDVLIGGAGTDLLVGGPGNDWIDDGHGTWLESSDDWYARTESALAAPEMAGDHHATADNDTVSTDSATDHVTGAGEDHFVPVPESTTAPATLAGFFTDDDLWSL